MKINSSEIALMKPSPGQNARVFGFSVLVSFVITLVLWLNGAPFFGTLVTSLSIAVCCHVSIYAGIYFLRLRFTIRTILLLCVPAGVFLGLLLSGVILGRDLSESFSPILSILVLAVVATTVIMAYLSMVQMREQLRREEINRLNSENQVIETQLRLLQSQIEPHFLFNTLSNVISLMQTDIEKAELMLLKLTQFLRVTLRRSRNETGSLQDELELVEDYLEIQKIRMGDRLRYSVLIDTDARLIEFPPLMLQPIVENAVIHGLDPTEQGGEITISVSVHSNLVVSVSDTGLGLASKSSGTGLGMSNVRKRLEILYGGKGKLTMTPASPQGLNVLIEMPCKRRA